MFFTIISVIIFSIIINYILSKRQFIYVNNLINIKTEYPLKILTYNIQRLPYTTKTNVDISRLLITYDIICFQENFCSISGGNKKKINHNCIQPAGAFFKLTDSGLTVYSKYHINFVEFVRFNNLSSIDKFSDKGFLVFKIDELYVVNSHLQASYNLFDKNENGYCQLNQIIEYCKYFEKVVICGDFNIDLKNLTIPMYGKITTQIPTHWSLMNGIFNSSCAVKKENYLPFYYDGGLYKNILVTCVKTENFIKDTDHLGVSFKVFL